MQLHTDAAREWLREHWTVEGMDALQAVIIENGEVLIEEMQAHGLVVADE